MNQWWANISIKYKLFLPLGFVTLVTGLFTYFYFTNLFETNEIDAAVDKSRTFLTEVEAIREFTAEQGKMNVFKTDLKTKDEILMTVPIVSAMKSAKNKAASLGLGFRVPKNSPRNEKNLPDDYEKKVLEKLEIGAVEEYYEIDKATNQLRYFRPVKLTEDCLKCHGDPSTSEKLWGNKEGKDLTGVRMENWKTGEVHGAFEVLMPMEPIQKANAKNSLIIGIIAFLSTSLVIVISLFGAQNMIKKFNQIVHASETMATGDLTKTLVSEANDEIGRVMSSYTQLSHNLRVSIENIKGKSSQIAESSQEIYNISDILSSNAINASNEANVVASATEEVSISISTMAATSEQMSVNAANVSASAELVSMNTNSIAGAIEEMSSSINQVSANAKKASGIAVDAKRMSEKASSTMESLGKAANDIGKVTELIKRIAEQTNLLALNARIEAASAGDAGKGFAVVANEIKELANQSANAAADINAKISGVQSSTSEAIAVIVEVSEIINTINQSVHEITVAVEQQAHAVNDVSSNIYTTQTNVSSIASNISEIATGSNDLAKSSHEAAKGSQDVARSIHNVSENARENRNGAEKLNDSAKMFNNIAQELAAFVKSFKV